MLTIIGIREVCPNGNGFAATISETSGSLYSPAKEKAAARGFYNGRSSLFIRRLRKLLGTVKLRLLLGLCIFCVVVLMIARLSSLTGWIPDYPSSSFTSISRGRYTVLINTWKRNSLLKQSVAHYASCSGTDAIHVVWSESNPPSDGLKAYLKKTVLSKSQTTRKPNFEFHINGEDNLNNRFKPIRDLTTDFIFSVDDDVIVPCTTLDFAFTVCEEPHSQWLVLSLACIGWIKSLFNGICIHLKNGVASYNYGGWWSVWWMGTYSMVLLKAAFFHKNYLNLYTNEMPSSIYDYVTKQRNFEDIAMSLLVANSTGAPPIWVEGKMYEIGSSGISSLKGHSKKRNKCLNDFISMYGKMPLVPTNVKAVDARQKWFW